MKYALRNPRSFKHTALVCAIGHVLAAALPAALAPALATAAETAATSARKAYNIPSGPLEDVLNRFGREAGILLSYPTDLTHALRSPGLAGDHTVPEGLALLLQGTGLQAIAQPNVGWTLVKRQADARPSVEAPLSEASAPEGALPTVTVTARARPETPSGPVSGYLATRSATATKTDTPIRELAQSISVVGREEIEAKGMRDLLDTLGYTPGIFARTWGHDDRGYEYMSLRGFHNTNDFTHNYLDGLGQWDFIDIGPMTEVYGLERIEVLRGPASATFGRGDIGGVINRVSKRPSFSDPVREVQLQLGHPAHRQVGVDVGGILADNLAYRLVGVERVTRDQAEYPNGERPRTRRQYVAPSFLWQPSAATSLTMLGSFIKHKAGDDAGYLSNASGQPTDVREGDPDYSRIVQKAWTLGYEFRHEVNETWGIRQNFRHAEREVDKHHIRPARLQADGRTVTRGAVRGFGDMDQTSVDSYLEARLRTGAVQHTLIAGLDWTRMSGQERELTGTAPNLDLLDPVYLPVPEPTIDGGQEGPYELSSVGVYVQDQMRMADRWLLTLSGRHDKARARAESSGEAARASADNGFTHRVGLTWLGTQGWTPYISHGTSFHPALGVYDTFTREPTEGRQWEAGVKFQPAGRKLLLAAAVFNLEKSNMVVTNPNTNLTEQVGRVRSRGLELEAKGQLTKNLFATGAYTYTDIEGKKGNTGYVQEGKTPVMAPRMMASVWLDYRLPDGVLADMSIGLGARYVGKRWDDPANTRFRPGYTLFDASLRHELDSHWVLALNATNLFGKDYYTSNVFGNWLRGEERSVTATVTYRW